MPRNETRPIEFSWHAVQRLDQRSVTEDEARAVVRGGAWHEDVPGRNGEPKWIAYGSIAGQWIKVVFVETTKRVKGEPVQIIEILYVLTVHL